jgi:hypothetical protein
MTSPLELGHRDPVAEVAKSPRACAGGTILTNDGQVLAPSQPPAAGIAQRVGYPVDPTLGFHTHVQANGEAPNPEKAQGQPRQAPQHRARLTACRAVSADQASPRHRTPRSSRRVTS